MHAPEVLLACARASEMLPPERDELFAWLDHDERDRARRFRFDADRHAFALAHALLRALVCAESGLAPEEVCIAHDVRGRPFVTCLPELHVSLSRSRDVVACAATRAAPVGIDAERLDGKPVDAGLIGAFVATHEPVTARQFFAHWTALEAFWKACGSGLADGQPRILCVPRAGDRFDVHVERTGGFRTGRGPCAARGAIVNVYADCTLAVVLRAPVEPQFILKRTQCSSLQDIELLARAQSTHEPFCAA